jgi:phosphoglycerol transferase MdoB-like AlkP superfamily enzyme
MAEHRKGPLVMALVRRQGVDPMSANVLVRGFVLEFFCVSLLAAVMALAARYGMRVQHRLALAVFIPLFAVMGTHAVDWNFLHLPDGYAIALFVDGLVAWLLAGVACALIISPRKD